jgi:hypothetical protein
MVVNCMLAHTDVALLQAVNIYGGYLKSKLKSLSDRACKKLSGQRALHRLNQVQLHLKLVALL